MSIETKDNNFLENGSDSFDYISLTYGDIIPKQNCTSFFFFP